MSTRKVAEIFHEIYYGSSNSDHESAAYRSNPAALSRLAKTKLRNVGLSHKLATIQAAKKWLNNQISNQLLKIPKKKFPRYPYSSPGIDVLLTCDLAYMDYDKRLNNGYNKLFVCVCIASRYLYCKPMKTTKSAEAANAFSEIINENNLKNKCRAVLTDRGSEFLGAPFQSVLKKFSVKHEICQDPVIKCSLAEKAVFQLKRDIGKYCLAKSTEVWVDMLEKIVRNINHAYNRRLKMSAAAARKNYKQVRKNLSTWQKLSKLARFKFNLHDKVRITSRGANFTKANRPDSWIVPEIYKISKRLGTRPPRYQLQDMYGNPVLGAFYEQEMQPVASAALGSIFKIKKVLRKRINPETGRESSLVEYTLLPAKYRSWVDSALVQGLLEES